MKNKYLLQLAKDELLDNLYKNRLIYRVANAVLLVMMTGGELPEDHEFTGATITYDRDDRSYRMVANDDDGGYVIKFRDPEHPVIVVLSANKEYPLKVPMSITVDAVKACKAHFDALTERMEQLLVKEFTSSLHYGNSEYLENEFKEFARDYLEKICTGSAKDTVHSFPFKLNFKSRLLDYLQENGGDINNIKTI